MPICDCKPSGRDKLLQLRCAYLHHPGEVCHVNIPDVSALAVFDLCSWTVSICSVLQCLLWRVD